MIKSHVLYQLSYEPIVLRFGHTKVLLFLKLANLGRRKSGPTRTAMRATSGPKGGRPVRATSGKGGITPAAQCAELRGLYGRITLRPYEDHSVEIMRLAARALHAAPLQETANLYFGAPSSIKMTEVITPALRRERGVAESSLCYTPQSLKMFWSETELFAPPLLRLRFGQKRLARQAELARLAINLDELDLDFVTDTEIVFDLLYALPVKLGDV